jgi:hypothetical protein
VIAANGTGAMVLTDVRARAAAALAPVEDTDPDVLMDVVDAVHPPVIILNYGDPWLVPMSMACLYECRLEVLCVASRVEPGPGIAKLEELVGHVGRRLQADVYSWPAQPSTSPRRLPIGGVEYLAAALPYLVRVTL